MDPAVFAALAEPNRRRILEFLGESPRSVGEVAGAVGLRQPTATKHLQALERAGLVDNARLQGERLRAGLAHPLITDIQGRGLLVGIGLAEPVAHRMVAEAQARGLIVNAASERRIRLAPPLIIGDAELDEFFRIFPDALEGALT